MNSSPDVLTPTEFAQGVQTLASAWCDVVPADRGDWQDARALENDGVHRLRISRLVRPHPFAMPRDEQNMSRGTTSPDRDIVRTGVETEREVHYDIVYSPTYQVPVLYLTFPSTDRSPLPSPDEVYNLLVPFTYRAQLQAVGPMSALSMTGEHPVTGGPAYFVHPCLTQDSMRAVLAGRQVSAAEYLAMWIGVIGATVGLSLPVSLARKLQNSDRTM